MANYIIHIDLLGSPGDEVYKELQTFMTAQGFSMTITNGSGGSAVLPESTYLGESKLKPAEAANRLRAALQEQIWSPVKVLAIVYSSAALAG